VWADQKRLLQVAYNLVINAIEHTPPNGRIVYGAEGVAGEVRVYVNDTGVGIPSEYQPVAFERFESTTRAKDARRAGLGLALVRSFVELHGGWVEHAGDVPLPAARGRGTCRRGRRGCAEGCESQGPLAQGFVCGALRRATKKQTQSNP
jgi:signal transduction histidine kinase